MLFWQGFLANLQIHDLLDCRDTEDKWRLAEVCQTRCLFPALCGMNQSLFPQVIQIRLNKAGDQEELLVHYIDWASKWDEWIPRNSNKLQPCACLCC